jgi:hypothetical protein
LIKYPFVLRELIVDKLKVLGSKVLNQVATGGGGVYCLLHGNL